MPAPAIETRGLRDFRRDLKRLAPEVAKELTKRLRRGAERIRRRAIPETPTVTGELAGSLRVSVTTRGAAITSRLPQAGVIHYGGTIQPRGVPIEIRASEFVSRAIDVEADALLEDIEDGVQDAARRAGFRQP